MKDRKSEIKPSEEFERVLAQCKPSDFDGHTEFYRLTPEQRREWLEQDDDVPFMMQLVLRRFFVARK